MTISSILAAFINIDSYQNGDWDKLWTHINVHWNVWSCRCLINEFWASETQSLVEGHWLKIHVGFIFKLSFLVIDTNKLDKAFGEFQQLERQNFHFALHLLKSPMWCRTHGGKDIHGCRCRSVLLLSTYRQPNLKGNQSSESTNRHRVKRWANRAKQAEKQITKTSVKKKKIANLIELVLGKIRQNVAPKRMLRNMCMWGAYLKTLACCEMRGRCAWLECDYVSVCDGCWKLESVSAITVGCVCSWEMSWERE